MFSISSLAVAALILGVATSEASAAVWVESVDAGDLPSNAQEVAGSGPLTAIEGTIEDSADQDMFLIFIADPAAFAASTNNLGTNLPVDNDTQLFLFDFDGFGVLANDDDPLDPLTFLSAVPAGSLIGDPDLYYLAVSIFDNDPFSPSGLIFPNDDASDGIVVGATGPGGASAITGWVFDPFPPDSGPYRIELSGATFVPEPTSSACTLVALGSLALGAALRSRGSRSWSCRDAPRVPARA